jgi:O-antigen/teichoic acid export membrane protein
MSELTTASPDLAAAEVKEAAQAPARFSSRRAYAQTFAASAAIRGLAVISGVLAARLLGPEGRGELAVIIFLPMLLLPLGELELPRSLAYEVSRVDRIPPSVIATSFWLALLLGSLQGMIAVAVLPFYLPADKLHVLVAARWFVIYLPALSITNALLGSDQGRGRFGRFSIFMALPGTLYVAAILVLWLSGRVSPPMFAAGVLAGVVVAAVVRAQMDWDAIGHTLPEWETAKRLLQRGLSFCIPALAGLLLCRADMFLLVRLARNDAIGLYAVAQAIALGQIGVVNPFIQVGFSAVAGEIEQEPALKTLARHFRLGQIAVVAIGLLAMGATPWLIRVMFGAAYMGAVTTTYLLIGSTVLWGMEQVLDQGLRAAGHPRPGTISNLLGLVVLMGLGIPACHRLGIVGLAACALAAQLLNLTVLVSFCLLALKIPVGRLWAFRPTMVRGLAREIVQMISATRVRV